ncbi:hemophore-related protein [Rhodococcus sp. NPDC003318]|uniref:hemophore-related protein n=1 Tax=Rhodococcus sp. NPDC003318 TaxID=3364503 RepID=UPI0036A8C2DA
MTLPARAALLTAGLAAASTLLGPAVAAGSPVSSLPLLQSTCSFTQIDAALHATAPGLGSLLDSYPQVERQLTVLFDQPADRRQREVDLYLAANPQLATTADQLLTGPRAEMIHGTLAVVAATCHNY